MSGHVHVSFVVDGMPAPQGSKRHVGKGVMVESSRKVAPWRATVAASAQAAMSGLAPLDGPLHVEMSFRLPMPTSRPKADRARGWRWADRRPDLDKLVRSTLDGITEGGVIVDDARVVAVSAHMVEVPGWVGVTVTVEPARPWALAEVER